MARVACECVILGEVRAEEKIAVVPARVDVVRLQLQVLPRQFALTSRLRRRKACRISKTTLPHGSSITAWWCWVAVANILPCRPRVVRAAAGFRSSSARQRDIATQRYASERFRRIMRLLELAIDGLLIDGACVGAQRFQAALWTL